MLTYAVKATVVDIYCSDIISVISPSLKETGLRTSTLHGTNRAARLEMKWRYSKTEKALHDVHFE